MALGAAVGFGRAFVGFSAVLMRGRRMRLRSVMVAFGVMLRRLAVMLCGCLVVSTCFFLLRVPAKQKRPL